MRPNTNFHNQYELTVEKADREKALSLFKKMSESRPGLMQEAEVKIKDRVDGSVYISINNVAAFDEKTTLVIKTYLNSIKYKKNC
jgi:hypothetical protein